MRSTHTSRMWIGCTIAIGALALAACGSSADGSSSASATSSAPSASASCTPKHSFSTATDGTLTALLTAYPPHGYVEDGQAKGVDGELIALIAEMECLTLDVKDADAAGIPDQIKTGRADVSGGDWWRSTARQEIVDMTIPIYLDGMAVISKDGSNTVDSLQGKTIGDLQGNVWNADAKEVYGDNYKLYKSFDQVIKDLKIGRIDVAIATPGTGAYYIDQEGLTGYQVEVLQADERIPASQKPPQAGLMTSLDNPELTAAFNENLQELIDNGTVAALLEKYGFPASAGETGEPYFT